MSPTFEKDPSILTLLDRLRDDLGSDVFDAVDHWNADLCAIGLGLPADHRVLVYVSTFGNESGKYDYELESPPTSEGEVYSVAGRGERCTYEELVGIIKSHLNF